MTIKRVLLGLGLWLVLGTPSLWAQGFRPAPQPQPAVSPYMNLLRQGNSPAFNYLTLVRPELDTNKSLDQLNNQVLQNSASAPGATGAGELTTGHAFGFQTQRRYFQTIGGRGGVGGGGAGGVGGAVGQAGGQGYGGGVAGFGNVGAGGVPGIR
jgi:hypothetical protein